MPTKLKLTQGRYSHMYILCAFMVISAFILDNPIDVWNGFIRILISPSNLITDYIEIGGLGAAFLNSGIIGLTTVFMLHINRVELNGAAIAGIITVFGFAFFGKTVYNSLPITFGVYLYSLVMKLPFKEIALNSLYATSLGPLISMLSFGMGLQVWKGIIVACICGIIIGFIVVPLSNSFINFHQGYNLYNTGFTSGIIGMVAAGLLRMFNLQVDTVSIISSGNNFMLSILLLPLFIFVLLMGLYLNNWSFKNYRELISYPGRLRTDFVVNCGYGITLVNMAVMAIIAWCYIVLIGAQINGATIGALLTIMGFSAFGKHPANTIPIFVGACIASTLNMHDQSSTVGVITVLFGSTLAPITGKFGIGAGLLAGFIHVSMTLNVSYIHGGMNLYNNGFSGGFVAAMLVPLFTIIAERKLKHKNGKLI